VQAPVVAQGSIHTDQCVVRYVLQNELRNTINDGPIDGLNECRALRRITRHRPRFAKLFDNAKTGAAENQRSKLSLDVDEFCRCRRCCER
jgi:hypothetical protein